MSKIYKDLKHHSIITIITFFEIDIDGISSELGQLDNVPSELIPKVGEYLSLEIYTLDEGGLLIDAQLVKEVQRYMTVEDDEMINKIFVTIAKN